MCIFGFPTFSVIPLHDHPGMIVFSKVLYGSLPVRAYDWVEPPQESKEPNYFPVRLAKLAVDKVSTAPCGTSILYPRNGGNLHYFTAVLLVLFLTFSHPLTEKMQAENVPTTAITHILPFVASQRDQLRNYVTNLHELFDLNLYGELNISRLEIIEDAIPRKGILVMKENLESLGLYWGFIPGFKDSFAKPPNAPAEVSVSGSHIALQAEKLIEYLQPHENLKNLVINGYPGTKFPDWALPNLFAADFTNCRRSEYLPALGNLPLLKTLSLHGMDGVKKIGREFCGDGADIWFPSLEELSISDFANLEEWSSANVGNSFPRLKKLTVKSCPKLAHIPLPQSLQHLELRNCNPTMVHIADLSLLSVLILDKIPDLVYLPEGLVASASLSSLKILSCPKLHSMPLEMQNLSSLKSLTIRWCEELSSLPQSLQNLKALESLEISNCNSLISLPDCGIGGLGSLRTLSIENCSNLTSLYSSLEQLTLLEHLTIMYCPNLSSFPAGVQHLSSLRSLIILSCPWFDSLPEGLQNVKTLHCLEIRSCPNLTYLPEWFKDLDCLRSLTIYDCPNLTLLPLGFNLLAKLQHLSIQECPELEERCRQGSGEDWSKIAHVPHKYIGSHQVKRSGKASSSGSSFVQASSQ